MADNAHHDDDHKGQGGGAHGGGGHGAGAHGGGGHEEHEAAPEWLISFADNVALLMGFFVILLAMNMAKPTAGGLGGEEKNPAADDNMLDFVIGMRRAFNNPVDIDSDAPADRVLKKRLIEKRGQAEGRSQQPNESGENESSQDTRPTEYSSLGGTLPFDNNSTSVNSRARVRAVEIGRRLRDTRWVIELRGYASPAETMQDHAKGFDLSYRRTWAAAEVLVAQGLRWDQLRLIACGDSDRKVARTYDRGLDSLNQRVEIIVTQEPISDSPSSTAKPKDDPGAKSDGEPATPRDDQPPPSAKGTPEPPAKSIEKKPAGKHG